MNQWDELRIIYDFKRGKATVEIAQENKIDLLIVEQIIRKYMTIK